MKLRFRYVVLFALVALCLTHSTWLRAWQQLTDQLVGGRARESFTISHTYLLERSAWFEFPLLPASEMVWVLTNANFPPTMTPPATTPWTRTGAVYTIDFQILDSADEVLESGTYHFRTQRLDLEMIPPGARAYYPGCSLVPSAAQSMRLRISRHAGKASRIRLRLVNLDAPLQDVSARVYCQDEVPDYKLTHAWRRTNQRKRERLTRASVYGPDLLTDYERRNLLKHRWRPVACLGLEGRDYQRRILYSPLGDRADYEGPPALPAGLLVDSWSKGVVPLPEGEGTVRLELLRSPRTDRADITIRWFGRRTDEIREWHESVSVPQREVELDARAGLLEIASTQELVVRVFWKSRVASTEAEFVDITPQLSLVRGYLLNPDSSVEYSIEHLRQQPTPFKLAFRALRAPDELHRITSDHPGTPRVVTWKFVAADGEVIAHGQMDVAEPVSRYDRVSSELAPLRVTDSAEYYFAVPSGVRWVRLESADREMLVSAYSRPPDIAAVTFVPEDYSAFQRQEGWRRRWFALRPTEHLTRINELRAVAVLVQPRPAELDPQLVAGCYQWQSFQPRGPWKARYLLVAREAKPTLKWEALGSAYYPLDTSVDHELTFCTAPGHRRVQPRLVCQNESDSWSLINVYVDGHLHQKLRLRPGLTEVPLDAVSVVPGHGTRLRLEASGNVHLLLSHIAIPSPMVFFKRMAIRMEGNTLQFDYDKRNPDEEVLALSLFRGGSGQRARLRVRIVGYVHRDTGPHPDWTVCDRVYELEPTQSVATLLFAAGDQVFEQQQCFLRLGSDLPPARYTIQVTREDNDEGYLLLTRTTPGLLEQRNLATEVGATVRQVSDQNRSW